MMLELPRLHERPSWLLPQQQEGQLHMGLRGPKGLAQMVA
jgi:hypothetical protein